MKLPRWLMITLMSAIVLSPPVAGVVWWVTWPDRTARDFLACVAAGQFNEANAMLEPGARWVPESELSTQFCFPTNQCVRFTPADWAWWCRDANVSFEPRTNDEFLHGRRRFSMLAGYLEFTVERDKITAAAKPRGRFVDFMEKYNRERLGLP